MEPHLFLIDQSYFLDSFDLIKQQGFHAFFQATKTFFDILMQAHENAQDGDEAAEALAEKYSEIFDSLESADELESMLQGKDTDIPRMIEMIKEHCPDFQ